MAQSPDTPRYLYRVQCPGSHTQLNTADGFIAQRPSYLNHQEVWSRQSLTAHFDWYSPIPTMYISLFGDRNHARNWAKKWNENNPGLYSKVYTIDTSMLLDGHVANARRLIDVLEIETPLSPEQHDTEFLCVNWIPLNAITGRPEDPMQMFGMSCSGYV